MNLHNLRHTLYRHLILPHATSDADRRRTYIFNVIVTGTIILSFLAFISSAISKLTRGTHYNTVPLVAMALITIFFAGLLFMSRRGYARYAAAIYIVTFFMITTYPVARWGILLPQGILTYCLIIVIAGVLLDAYAAFVMTGVATLTLLVITHLHDVGRLPFDRAWMQTTGGYNDVIIYAITFSIVALVCWLSNRQIEESLRRARQSEQALRIERNMLETRVEERTKELERAQVEKLEELNRFAEFGRISSTLLHELANSLTAAALNLELMKNKRTTKLYDQLHESISYMEEYLSSARRQLRRQSEIHEFSVCEECQRVIDFLLPKARALRVKITHSLKDAPVLTGDSVKFNQILSNLIVNALDSYESLLDGQRRTVHVQTKKTKGYIELSVTDHGIGISSKDIASVFKPFYTTKASDRGTGLGLTITKRTIEEDFGGTIKVTSNKREGTQFIVRLPLS